MIAEARARSLSMSRSLRSPLLMVACVVLLSVSDSSADNCGFQSFGQPPSVSNSAAIFALDASAVITSDGALPRSLSAPTVSRLVTLDGPYQSFQASKIAKDPRCGRWGGRDKVRHAAIFFAATLGLQLFIESTFNTSKTEAFLVSAAIGTLVGVGKELYDWRISDKDCFSEQDLLANTAGILGAGVVIMISN